MPEATVLYSVTAAVVVGLVVWVAVVLKTAKQPWARPGAVPRRAEDVPVEGQADAKAEANADAKVEANADAKVEADADADGPKA